MSLFKRGEMSLTNGRWRGWTLDPEALTDEDIATFAEQTAAVVGFFSSVEAATPAAERLAAACAPAKTGHGPTLIVDIVTETPAEFEAKRGDRDPTTVVGITLFNRGELPRWAQALFTLHSALRS